MALGEQLISELRFGYQELSTGVGAAVQLLGKLDGSFNQSFAKISDGAKAAFADFARQAKIGATEYKAFSDELSKSNKALSLDAVADRMGGIARAGKDLFVGTINQGANFQTELLKINTIAGLSEQQLDAYGESLRTMGRELGVSISPAQTAASAYEVLSSGFTSAADSQAVLASSLKLSQGGQAEVADTTRLLSGALNAYGASAQDASKYSDMLFQTVNLGVTTVPELAQSLGQVVSVAAIAGVSFQELTAAIATATANGQQTTTSIAGLRGIISALIKPGKEAADTMAHYGLVVNASTLKQDGLLVTLQKIKAAVGSNTTAFKTIIADQEAFATASNLVSDGGVKFQASLDGITNSAGSTDKALASVNQGLQQSGKQLQTSLSELAASASKSFLPIITGAVKGLTGLVDLVDKIPGPIKAAGLAFIGIGAALAAASAATVALGVVLPIIQGQYLAVATRAIPLATAAWGVLNTEITLSMVAKGLLRGVLGGLTLAYNVAAGAVSGFATVVQFALGATAGGVGLVLTAGAAVIAWALIVKHATDDVSTYNAELAKANKGLREFEDAQGKKRTIHEMSRSDAVNLSAKQLADKGVTADDLTQKILDTRNRAEDTDDSKIKAMFLREAEKISEKRKELIAEIEKRGKEKPVELSPIQTAQEQKKASEEAFKDELQKIELSKAGHAEKISQLKALLAWDHLEGSERRQLIARIAQEQDKADEETAKKKKQLHAETIAQARQEIENSGKPEAVKIKALHALIAQYHLVGDERRAIEDKILAYETAAAKKREQLVKHERELRKDASEGRVKDSDLKSQAADLKESHGANVLGERVQEIKVKAKEKINQVDIQLEADTQGQTDSGLIKEAKSKAASEKVRIEREAQLEMDNLKDQAVQKDAARQTESLQSQQRIASAQIELIQQRVALGQASEAQLRDAVIARLKLQEQEIAIQQELAKRATEDPVRIAQIEAESQAAILTARKGAREEIERATKAIQDQQKAQKAAMDFTLGNTTTGGQAGGDFGSFDVKKRPGKDPFGGSGRDPFGALSALDLKPAQDALLQNKPGSRTLYELQQRGATPPPVGVKLGATFILKDSKGKDIDFTIGDVSLDGQNSSLDKISKGML